MKAFMFVCMALCLLDLVRSEDDGSYRPDLYGNKFGAFNRAYDGRYNYRYNNYFNRNNAYYPNAYQPLYQQLAPPVVAFRENSVIPSSTIRPVVSVSTAASPTKYVYPKNYGNEAYARIIEQDSDSNINSYQYRYKTENGISAAESGVVDSSNSAGGTRVSGFYEYVGADGVTYRVDYTADENGFHPTGAHLP